MCGQESDGDRGVVEENEEVRSASGWITSGMSPNDLSERELSEDETQCRIRRRRRRRIFLFDPKQTLYKYRSPW